MKLKPFKALYYNKEKVELSDVIAPNYDLLTDQIKKNLIKKNKYNCVQFLIPKKKAKKKDIKKTNELIKKSIEKKIIIEDEKQSFYFIKYTYTIHEQTKTLKGIIGRGEVTPFSKQEIYPHEETKKTMIKNQLNWSEETQWNTSQIMMLYEDTKNTLNQWAEKKIEQKKSIHQFNLTETTKCEYWSLSDIKTINHIQKFFKRKKIVIANGHHRYNTALKLRKKYENKIPDTKYTMYLLVNNQDQGLKIKPFHRWIKALPMSVNTMDENLKKYFNKKEMNSTNELIENLKMKKTTAFGYLSEDKIELLTLKKRQTKSMIEKIKTKINTEILNEMIFKKIFKWTNKEINESEFIKYTDQTDLLSKWCKTKKTKGFILQEIKVNIFKKWIKEKRVTPQKTTSFYPKLFSGILFYRIKK